MYTEDDLLPISALQHLLFCERQCALIHVEQAWSENRLTVEGRQMHAHVDAGGRESRGDVRTEFGVAIKSLRLGLAGIADVVEFRRADGSRAGVSSGGTPWQPFPVEYKRGKPKVDRLDEVQLCAQALCLEEMLGCPVLCGALFYGNTRRRSEVEFGNDLRQLTVHTAGRLHALVDAGVTPAPVCEPKCQRCSLQDLCVPTLAQERMRADEYLSAAVSEVFET